MDRSITSTLAPSPTSAADATTIQPADPQHRARAEQAAVRFEGLFISQMLQQMRKSAREIAGDNSLLRQKGSDMLDYADTLVADQLAGQRAFGIADMLLRQLLPPAAAAPAPLNVSPPPVALQPKDSQGLLP
ncbi:MAG TPA: flagellar biosynthesis protein FlgJ [Acidovorax sp.]|nr:flagellar biosynthesis protein FlgJ [Acidovorax sp.]